MASSPAAPSRAAPHLPRPAGHRLSGARLRLRSDLRLAWDTACSLALLQLWALAALLALRLEPARAAVALLFAGGGFACLYLLRPVARRQLRTRALLRLRTPTCVWRWAATLAMLPPWAALCVAWAPGSLPKGPSHGTAASSLALIAPLLAGVVLLAVVEEFFLRGWVQRRLELRFGRARGLLLAAMLSVAASPWTDPVPMRLVRGLVMGTLAQRSRSIWPGVVLNAAGSAAALLWSGTDRNPSAPARAGPDADALQATSRPRPPHGRRCPHRRIHASSPALNAGVHSAPLPASHHDPLDPCRAPRVRQSQRRPAANP